jgi:hypothetical protein
VSYRLVSKAKQYRVEVSKTRRSNFIKVSLSSSAGETVYHHLTRREARRLAAALLLAETLEP